MINSWGRAFVLFLSLAFLIPAFAQFDRGWTDLGRDYFGNLQLSISEGAEFYEELYQMFKQGASDDKRIDVSDAALWTDKNTQWRSWLFLEADYVGVPGVVRPQYAKLRMQESGMSAEDIEDRLKKPLDIFSFQGVDPWVRDNFRRRFIVEHYGLLHPQKTVNIVYRRAERGGQEVLVGIGYEKIERAQA